MYAYINFAFVSILKTIYVCYSFYFNSIFSFLKEKLNGKKYRFYLTFLIKKKKLNYVILAI